MTRTRAVLLGDGRQRTLRLLAEHATARDHDVVAVAGNLADALYEVTHGRAEVVVVLHTDQLRPLVEVVSDGEPSTRRLPQQRRPNRAHIV